MQKNSFVLPTKLNEVVAKLSDKQAGVLFKGILSYAENGTVANFEDNALTIAFTFVKQDMDYTAKKYAETCAKRAESGRLGGRPKKANESKKSKCFLEKANESKQKHNDNDNEDDNDSNTILTDSDTITTLSQKDPQAGTFRAVPKSKIQKFGVWWVKNYYPELYATAGAKSTAAWFKRYGKALSEILNLADGNIPLAISSVLATEEQMADFQKRKGEAICWGLDAVSRNFTENFNRANEILNSGNLPKEVMQYA